MIEIIYIYILFFIYYLEEEKILHFIYKYVLHERSL